MRGGSRSTRFNRPAAILPSLCVLLACAGESPKVPEGSNEKPGPRAKVFPFTDVTASSGVDFVHHNGATPRRHFPETMAPGLALFDVDSDGDLDLYAVDSGSLEGASSAEARPGNRLYLNRGDGVFEDATETFGAADRGYGMGVAVGDYDGDGAEDLYVVNFGANALYRNLGHGRFERVEAGVEDAAWSVAAAFLDYDGDEDLDLYVVNYLDYDVASAPRCKAGTLTIYCSPERFAPAADRLYRNDRGRFVDVSEQAGILPAGRGMGLATGDLDGDGDTDIYVTNDRSQNHLYIDEGDRFVEMGAEASVGYSATGQPEGSMGAVIGDFTGTGRPAIFATNFQKEPNRLYVAAGDGFFDDRTYPSGLGFPSNEMVSWGMAALDLEGDGDLDLAVANGHVYDNAAEFIRGSSYAMRDQLFVNDGAGVFEAVGFPGAPLSSRGVVAGDFDGDGDPDLIVASCADRIRLWRNEAGKGERFLILELEGRPPNTSAHGARVVATVAGTRRFYEVGGGGGYASHSDTRLYIGLGEAAAVERLEVRWPDGSVEEALDLRGGRRLTLRQGQGIVAGGS